MSPTLPPAPPPSTPAPRRHGRASQLDALFAEYTEAHRHPLNRLCHKLAIPPIVLTLVALLDRITLGEPGGLRLTAAMPALLLAGAWYVRMDLRLGSLMALLAAACLPLGRLLPLSALVTLAVVAWAVQFIGHYAFERRQPSFFTNLVQSLVGPIYFLDSVASLASRPGGRDNR